MSDLGKTYTQSYNDWLNEHDEKVRADEREKVLDELNDIRDNLPFEYNNDFAWILAEYEKLNSHK